MPPQPTIGGKAQSNATRIATEIITVSEAAQMIGFAQMRNFLKARWRFICFNKFCMSFISFSTRFSRIVALIFFLSKVEIKSKPKLPLSSIAYPSFLSSTNNRARNKGKMDKKKAPRIPIRGAFFFDLLFFLLFRSPVQN